MIVVIEVGTMDRINSCSVIYFHAARFRRLTATFRMRTNMRNVSHISRMLYAPKP